MSLQEIQMNLKCPKDKWNKFGKYNYRSLEGILDALKPWLIKFDYTMIISDKMVEVGGRVYVEATATIYDKDCDLEIISNTAYAREADTQSGMAAAQITGSTSSYARKYCLNGLFCIDDTKDDDATNKHGKDDSPAKKAEAKSQIATQNKKQASKDKPSMTLDELCSANAAIEDIKIAKGWWDANEKEMTGWTTEDQDYVYDKWVTKGKSLK